MPIRKTALKNALHYLIGIAEMCAYYVEYNLFNFWKREIVEKSIKIICEDNAVHDQQFLSDLFSYGSYHIGEKYKRSFGL